MRPEQITLSGLMALPEDELLKWLQDHPVSGGDHEHEDDADEDDEDQDDEDDTGEDDEDDDGDKPGKKDKSSKAGKSGGKLYTKEELDAIVEKNVKDRLARQSRAAARKAATDGNDHEALAKTLQKEIDEEWKPKADAHDSLQARVTELEEVVTEQIDAILETLPQELQDLDLGDDEDAVKRLRWLVTKVVPKAGKAKKDPKDKTPGNPPGPAPKNKQGEDDKKPVNPPVRRNKF